MNRARLPGPHLLTHRLEDQVERRFGNAPEVGEAGLAEHLGQAGEARLCAEHELVSTPMKVVRFALSVKRTLKVINILLQQTR